MQRFNVLDHDLDLLQSRFLEASAGTGKTFAIEHLFARLVREKGLDPSEILAVTFTREAAHEMKTRIREKLETDDELPVFTIHGFCSQMLKEYAFEAKAPFNLSDPDELDYLTQMEQVVEDFIRTASPEFAPFIALLLRKHRFDFDKFKQAIITAMSTVEESKPFSLEMPSLEPAELEAQYYDEAPKYKYLKLEKYAHQIQKYLDIEHPHELLLEKEWFFEKMDPSNARKGAEVKRHPGFERLRHQLSIARESGEILKRVALECSRRWEIRSRRFDSHSFDDLLLNMQKALEEERFIEQVRARFKVVIVDEFQDTDSVQWNIFKRLFLDTHILYLVGDPKQSIYSFRRADIYTYMEAGKALGEKNKAFLDTNYRSSPKLIEALNGLFTQDPKWIELPSLPNALSYIPVRAGRDSGRIEEPPLQGFLVEGVKGKERSWPTKQMEEEALFPYIAREIIRLHTSYNLPFSEMAVLIKDRFQGQRFQQHLNAWKIPSAIKRTLNLSESRGYGYMQLLLKALLEPDATEIVRATRVEHNPFFMLKEHFLEEGFGSTFSLFLKEHFQGDSQLLIELKQTAEILFECRGNSLEQLIHELQKLKDKDPEEDPRLKVRGAESEDSVSIMTTFASKGLEFDVVFALGLAYRYPEQDDEEKRAEKMRQLYVALTRPREKLYIPLVQPMEGNSPLELFFKNSIGFNFPIERIDSIPIASLTKEEEITYEQDPEPFNMDFPIHTLSSFTSLAKPLQHTLVYDRFSSQDLSKKTAHTLPLGAETGTLIHAIFESHFDQRHLSIEQIVMETLNGTHLEGWEETIVEMVESVLQMPLHEGMCLKDLQEGDYVQEMEFLYPESKSHLIKGFADLIFQWKGRFYLLDWKTNWLGPSDADYTQEKLEQAMKEHDYYLQAKLYSEAIRRYIHQLCPDPQFGGAHYIFVRGKKGVYFEPC